MTGTILDEWLEQREDRIDNDEWWASLHRYLDKNDVEKDKLYYEVPHPTFRSSFQNWLRLLPDNAVVRLKSASNLDSALGKIVDETYQKIESDINWDHWPSEHDDRKEPTDTNTCGVKARIYNQIVVHFGGDLDWEIVYGDKDRESSDPPVEHPDFLGSVTVKRVNERNCLDIIVYEFSSGEQFFSNSYGSSSLMLQRILSSDIEPASVIHDVAFDMEGASWSGTNPPEHPIHRSTTDHKNRINFTKVDNPAEYYGSTWGDLEAMNKVALESDGDGTIQTYSSGVVDWQIPAGIQL